MSNAWRRLGSVVGIGVAVGAAAGCGTSGKVGDAVRTALPRGQAYALYTHCGIHEAKFGKTYYVAEHPLDDGQGNPPPDWANPFQLGTMTALGPP